MSSKQITTLTDSLLSKYLIRVSKIKMLTEQEEHKLAVQWKEEGDQVAAQKLMVAHLPLVVKVAFSFKNYGQSVLDIISEGNIGLMRAIYKFDPYKGFRLSTYAIWWIKAYITEYILNSWSLVKSGSIAGRKKLFFSLRKLKQKLGISTQTVTEEQAEQISNQLYVSKDDVKYINNMLENRDLYLETPIYSGDNQTITYGDMLRDTNSNPEEITSAKEDEVSNKNLASLVMNNLNPRERFIIEQRFLIDSPRSLRDIGDELNLSRERVRQIEAKALEKAKHYISATK